MVWTIHEDVLLSAVTVHVYIGEDVIARVLLDELADKGFDSIHNRMKVRIRFMVPTVEIRAGEGGAVVSGDHAIWVGERDHVKNDALS